MSRNLPVMLKSSTIIQKQKDFPKIGLCLGGGGARGLAHILVLEVFDELGICPSIITGTSIGALFAAGYASGLSASHIRYTTEEILATRIDIITKLLFKRTKPLRKVLKIFPMRSAFLDSFALLELLIPELISKTFEELKIPIKIVATNLSLCEPYIFDSGNLGNALAASIAIPGLFSPVDVDGVLLSDGGIVDPLPYLILPKDIDLVIAVDVSGGSRSLVNGSRTSIISTLIQSVSVLQKAIIEERLRQKKPDLYIKFTLEKYGGLHFHKADEILKEAALFKSEFRNKFIRLLNSQSILL
ncbi:MAG: hypothetical protein TECD_00298 [Hyphomicrobiaceae bacterium hypho_1]